MSVRPSSPLRWICANDMNLQNLDVPMEDDVLSDVVPSNIVSRQVWFSSSFQTTEARPHDHREGERGR